MNLRDLIQLHAQHPIKKRYKIAGMDISIESPKGDSRHWTDEMGNTGTTVMKHDYGYVRMSEGHDGEHVDCFIGPDPNSDKVFIIDQHVPETGKFDEQKCMIGFHTPEEAKQAYLIHYDKPGFFGSMKEMSMQEFKTKVLATKDSANKMVAQADHE